MKVSKQCKVCIAKEICSMGIDTTDKECITFHKLLAHLNELENYEPCPNCGEVYSMYRHSKYSCSNCHCDR